MEDRADSLALQRYGPDAPVMRSLRSLRHRAQTGLRRSTAEHRRRVAQAWRDLSDLPDEVARDVSRRFGSPELRRVEVPVRIRDH